MLAESEGWSTMEEWILFAVILLVAGLFVAIVGDPIAALILTVVWGAAIWALVVHGESLLEAVWPAVLIVLGLIVVSVGALIALAAIAEDKRFKRHGKDSASRGR